ncbi:MAG: GxxExxY protein [Bacteroidetes bacterium]|jgi:GxxExxY protein|nr:MAG: GxxExxY protein [Bacteroidota bacterium]
MSDIILKEESYKIIGACMEVHRELGFGFKEIIYKDALEIEFKSLEIPYQREKLYKIEYKGKILPRRYPADFVIYDSIILEVKAMPMIINNFVLQTRNYLKASGIRLGIIANFGESSFKSKRVVF